ncbi:hypothetical protein IG193_03470 [Infirmifilum lucidum]|uniref:Uncharacterized protein n=1 Tax=Infirmifilum lucidum TaxID=2776706 RepID=A0A7L9FIB2_9CREN|nr:V-type ATP synthase subunit F [Infirmifilum lucidum]QOJ79530.1 hypothetical protein IG193_03470 [Infirmifilum lucidum]
MFKAGMRLRIGAVVLEDLEGAIAGSGVDKVYVVAGPQEALRVIEEVVKRRDVDLLLVDDVLVSQIGKSKLAEIKYRNPFPAIVELETNRVPRPVNS